MTVPGRTLEVFFCFGGLCLFPLRLCFVSTVFSSLCLGCWSRVLIYLSLYVFSFSRFLFFFFLYFSFLSFYLSFFLSLSLSLFLCYVLYLSVFFSSIFLSLSFWFFLFICVFLSFFLSFCLSLVLSSLSLFTSFRFPLSFLMLLSSFLVCLPRSFSFSFSSFLPSFLPVFLSVFLSLSHCYILRWTFQPVRKASAPWHLCRRNVAGLKCTRSVRKRTCSSTLCALSALLACFGQTIWGRA